MSLVPPPPPVPIPIHMAALNADHDFWPPEVHAATANNNDMCLYVNDFLLSNT